MYNNVSNKRLAKLDKSGMGVVYIQYCTQSGAYTHTFCYTWCYQLFVIYGILLAMSEGQMPEDKKSTKITNKSPKIVTKKKFALKMPKFKFFSLKKLKNLNRRAILAASLAAILLFTGLFAVIFNKSTNEVIVQDSEPSEIVELETAAFMSATVTLQEGVAEYKTDELWEPAPKDLEILPGMSYRTTGAISKAIITLGDGSDIRLDANTEVNFQTLTVARVVVEQKNGHIYNRITANNNRKYVVQTENAQIQALGTAFKTTANGDEESVEVYQGSVQETSINKRADEGQKLYIKNYVTPSKDETTEQLDIETVKKDEFVIWNREIDSSSDKFKDTLGFLSDVKSPEISITSPELGSTVELEANSTEGTVEIEGATENGAKLTVQSKSVTGEEVVDVAVNNDGTFKTPVLKTIVGSSIFEFIATDKVGNKTTLNITIIFKNKTVVQEQAIALTIDTSDPAELAFAWGLVGMTTPNGVKLVYSEEEMPSYPDDEKATIETGTSSAIEITDPPFESGKTYYFKVCRFIESTTDCDIYSNEVSVDIP